MVVTERDLKTLPWVNSWNGVTVDQIGVRWNVDFSTAARRVRKLIDAGLLCRHYVNGLNIQPIAATRLGCSLARDELEPLSGVRLATWHHDSTVVDLAPRIVKRFGEGILNSDRRIRQRRRLDGIKAGHVPDLELIPRQGRPIAFEVELSMKAPARLQSIIDAYASANDYGAVYYLVPDARLARFVRRFTDGLDHLVRVAVIRLPDHQEA